MKSMLAILACLTLLPALAQSAPATQPVQAPELRPQRPGEYSPPPEPERPISIGDAAILGVVEGLTEYLPVSSTGHLILASHYLGLTEYATQTEEPGLLGRKLKPSPAVTAFEIVIQLGAILAVVGLYRRRVSEMVLGMGSGTAALLRGQDIRTQLSPTRQQGLKLVGLLAAGFMPAAVAGLLLHEPIEANLFSPTPVAYALAAGGVFMIVAEFWYRRTGGRKRISRLEDMTAWHAFAIGMAQTLAMWPGTSRSMITIVAALVVGLDMLAAAEFSFLLALPTLTAATVLSGAKHHEELLQAAGPMGLTVGMIVSAITAAIAVKGFVSWLTKHGLTPFGVYRLALAAVVIWYFSRF